MGKSVRHCGIINPLVGLKKLSRKRIFYDTSTENRLKFRFLHLHVGTLLMEKDYVKMPISSIFLYLLSLQQASRKFKFRKI